eukprot:3783824-Pleurochrysis_carterae.AAC.2
MSVDGSSQNRRTSARVLLLFDSFAACGGATTRERDLAEAQVVPRRLGHAAGLRTGACLAPCFLHPSQSERDALRPSPLTRSFKPIRIPFTLPSKHAPFTHCSKSIPFIFCTLPFLLRSSVPFVLVISIDTSTHANSSRARFDCSFA